MPSFIENLSETLVYFSNASDELQLLVFENLVPCVISVETKSLDLCKLSGHTSKIYSLLRLGTARLAHRLEQRLAVFVLGGEFRANLGELALGAIHDRELCPGRLGKEGSLFKIAIIGAGRGIVCAAVLDDAVTKLEIATLAKNKVDYNTLSSLLNSKIGLGENTKCSLAIRVSFFGVGQDLLVRNIDGAWHNSKDNGS
ncbi:hypothetical protein HG530_005376 [Fusarium avenaceum]|nr:hypothetical protein HG530_005376 [Fusarium avenaceum]